MAEATTGEFVKAHQCLYGNLKYRGTRFQITSEAELTKLKNLQANDASGYCVFQSLHYTDSREEHAPLCLAFPSSIDLQGFLG
jgi:hypothetical protein